MRSDRHPARHGPSPYSPPAIHWRRRRNCRRSSPWSRGCPALSGRGAGFWVSNMSAVWLMAPFVTAAVAARSRRSAVTVGWTVTLAAFAGFTETPSFGQPTSSRSTTFCSSSEESSADRRLASSVGVGVPGVRGGRRSHWWAPSVWNLLPGVTTKDACRIPHTSGRERSSSALLWASSSSLSRCGGSSHPVPVRGRWRPETAAVKERHSRRYMHVS